MPRPWPLALAGLVIAGCIALPEPLDSMGTPDAALPDEDGAPRPDGAVEATPDAAAHLGADAAGPDPDPEAEPDPDPMPEQCNGVDDDLDDSIDEGVQNDCGACGAPPDEVCDGFDNDCDLVIDEGAGCACLPGTVEACGLDRGACTVGERSCDGEGTWGECDGVRPTAELCNDVDDDCDGDTDEGVQNACGGCGALPADACNGVDDDCDGRIDAFPGADPYSACDCAPGQTRSCGSDTGRCERGTESCAAGHWGACAGGVGPVNEVCNGEDDDCNGIADEGACACMPGSTRACGSGTGRCEPGTERCGFEGWGACEGAVGPQGERCDGVDDDCDGATDEGVALGACNSGQPGVCAPGHQLCTGGAIACRRDVDPGPEQCNGVDDDCDGRLDEGAGGGQCNTGAPGPCSAGDRVCRGGAIVCEQRTGPGVEVCDGIDNDCDGTIDDDVALLVSCQTGQPGACAVGTPRCVGGAVSCRAPAPRGEVCNGGDDDCDGAADEALSGQPCQTGLPGSCAVGATLCEPMTGVRCVAMAAGNETCNGQDDDCDGAVDEGFPTYDDCLNGLPPRRRYCDFGQLIICDDGGIPP